MSAKMDKKYNAGIESKAKACCANCKNIGVCVLPSSECNYCSLYDGEGVTPEQMLNKFKKRIARLKAKMKRYQKNSASYGHTDGHETNMPITVNGVKIEPEAISEILEDWRKTYTTPLRSLMQFLRAIRKKLSYLNEKAKLTPFKSLTLNIKPIIWGNGKYNEELSFKFETSSETNSYQIRCYFRNEVLLGVWFGESEESTVAKAQAWLNALVEQCVNKTRL